MDLQYLIREPMEILPTTPALFMIHGYGSNENDLFSFVPDLPEDWLIVSFRAPLPVPYGGYSWYEIDFTDPEKYVDTAQAHESLNALLDHILKISSPYDQWTRMNIVLKFWLFCAKVANINKFLHA